MQAQDAGRIAGDDDRTVAATAGRAPAGAPFGANALPVGTRLHEFEIVGLIGEGGFGIVYLAHDCVLERKVALKEYLPSTLANRGPGQTVTVASSRHVETFQVGLRSFVNEARMLAQFDHPALVKVYRFWEANGTAYMVMPYYEGITLKEALRRAGEPPDEPRLKNLLGQLLEALEVLHGANALHRDIAPDNILMLASDAPVLLDFGAARRVISDRTQTLTVILKPGFAPVEQYAEMTSMKQGPWTDLYALAAVMHFAITGAAPVAAVARTISDPVLPLEQAAVGRYTAEFLRALDRALAVKPDDRPQSVAEFRAQLGLDRSLRSIPGAAAAGERKEPFRMGLLAGLTVVLAGAIAAGAILVAGKRPSSPLTVTAPVTTTQPDPAMAVPSVAAPPVAPAPILEPPIATATAPPVATPPPEDLSPAPVSAPREPSRTTPLPAKTSTGFSSSEAASLVAATLQDGEKCFTAKQYDCAIANANAALRVDPNSTRAQRLKADSIEEQRRALSEIKIE